MAEQQTRTIAVTDDAGFDPDLCVWISTTTNRIHNVTPIERPEFIESTMDKLNAEERETFKAFFDGVYQGWKRGDILTSDMVGDIWYYNSKAEYYTSPFVSGGGLPMISDAARRVLEMFELGNTVLHPITLMNSEETERTTSEPYYLLNVGNTRAMGNYETLGPEGDRKAPLRNNGAEVRYRPRSGQETELVVVPDALGGPDIWLDPKVPEILFLSDALAQGLKEAGVDDGRGLERCAVGYL